MALVCPSPPSEYPFGSYFPLARPFSAMSQFTVSGTFEARDGRQAFERSVDAENEDVAEEHVLSQFGAEHNLARTEIEIEEVTAA